MSRIVLNLRPAALLSVGFSHPRALGPDIPFASKPAKRDRRTAHIPYIPGSTVKGSLRSAASRIAKAYGFTSCGEGFSRSMKDCDVCSLFGKPGITYPKVFFSDFVPDGEVKFHSLTRVGIDDKSSTASEHTLFSVECVAHPTVFRGEVNFRELSGREFELLLLALAELRLDRFGRSSFVDLRIEEVSGLDIPETLKEVFEELCEWLWT
ncbi:MAG: RAMP superfamily CRISPR-associated protein [Candidatus Caldarchaeum sp.]|nr:RAMP superfamily CRISPR-associated protein [Candidatus Caldarchaeum sp.]MCS7138271.1 RAMP superfamily CRISPR-associated protein [Candidatus Caldarchaeum sp.]MDW8360481.1 RAMP superfamily CRISPR-associated protein [Candidatus Caldarchaeum sp.]